MFNAPSKTTLIVEDDLLFAGFCQQNLNIEGWQTQAVSTGKEGLDHLRNNPPDVLLLDIFLPDLNGIDILKIIQDEKIPTVVVIMTGKGSIDMAVEAMRIGAFDFIEKPIETERLLTTMGNALRHQKISQKIHEYENSAKRSKLHKLIGASLPMQTLFRIIDNVAESRASVFITGESGTGKELCAEAIHLQGPRKNAPFIVINCAAIPHKLMESEIFGHVKGAFSDAQHYRQGAASLANGGTLFLDEICDMDLELQSKLLRFIQSGRIKKVGSDQEEPVDVRFICATNKDPREQIQKGTFREDLFYRLHVVPITIPPLRERGEDVIILAHNFLIQYAKDEGKAFNRISTGAANALFRYGWPGNVRELQNIIQQTVVLHNAKKLTKEILPPELNGIQIEQPIPFKTDLTTASPTISSDHTPIIPLIQVEMSAIDRAIEQCDGNIQLAADLLDIDQSTIYRKRKKLQ